MRDAQAGRLRLAAYALCQRDGATLLCRLSSTERAAGRWMLPGGGLDFGEDPELGVLRELEEETGLRGTVGELVAVASHVWPAGVADDGRPLHTVGILYRVAVGGEPLRHEPDGSTDLAAWIDPEDLARLPLTRMGAELLGKAGLVDLPAATSAGPGRES